MVKRNQIQKKKLASDKGFTLVELMVVVAITALIAGFTVSEINSTSHKLKSTARTLRAKMQQARLLAIKENCNVFVDFGLNISSYTLWRDGDNNDTYTAIELIETIALPNDISFGAVASEDGGPSKSASPTSDTAPPADGISFGSNRVQFTPQGTASNAWAYLHAPNKDSSGTYAVGSNNVGRIQSRYWVTNGGAWR